MAENTNVNESFDSTVDSLFKGMENFITTKTVVGDAIKVSEDTIILPLVDVAFGVGAGATSADKKGTGGGGMGGKMSPSAVLLIKNGVPQLVNIKEQDGITKVLDMVPGLIDKIKGKDKADESEAKEDAEDALS